MSSQHKISVAAGKLKALNAQRKVLVTTDEYKEAEINFAPESAAPPLADAALFGAAFVLEVCLFGGVRACVYAGPYMSTNV